MKERKILITTSVCIVMLLSLTVLGIRSGYFNQQTSTVESSNTPFPIGTSNVAFQLKVSTMSPLPADGVARSYVVWVQIQDLYGNPTRARTGGVGVSLSSSNPVIGTGPNTINIAQGSSFAYTGFTSGYKNGTTTITASAPGLVSGSATMTTITNVPTKLAVYLTPSTVFADGGAYSIVTVALQDSTGSVSWAPASGVGVALSSSDPTVGSVPSNIFFNPGYQYCQTTFYSTTTKGNTTIYATALGFTTGSATVKTIAVNTNPPKNFKTFLGPPKVWAWGGATYSTVVDVQLLDAGGVPTKAPSPVIVSLTSSNSLVGTVPATMTIPTGSMYYRANFVSTDMPGSTVIKASATGFGSSSATMTTNGYVPTKLKIYTMLDSGFADKTLNNVVFVELQDSSGRPARAATDTIVSFVSSDPTVGTPQYGTATITAGNVHGGVWFYSTYKKGTATITASSTGFTSAATTVRTVGPTPYKLGLYLAPSKVWADGRTYSGSVRIVLEDSSGNPVRARAGGITVALSTANPAIGTVGSPVTISEGGDGTSTWFKSTSSAGTTSISASASGLVTGSATMTTVTTPPTPGPVATKLVIEGRLKYISNNIAYYDIAVSLRDASNKPARAPSTTGVAMVSSDSIIGVCTYNFQISANNFYASAGSVMFQTTYTPGTTTITATARNSTTTISGTNTFTTGEYCPISKSYVFGNIPYLFYKNTFLVVGNATTADEIISSAVFEPSLISAGTLAPTIKTDALLMTTDKTTGNLIAFSYNNTVRTSYPLGIVVTQNATWFNITATVENLSLNFTKSSYPNKSVAIAYLAKEGTRTIMYLWGYGWQGTYASALFMSNIANWQTYATKHLLFLQWTDTNTNKLVEATEITVASSA
jgi:hypothetical protein